MNALSLAFKEDTRAFAGVPPRIAPETLLADPHAAFATLRPAHAVIQIGEGQYMALRAKDVLAMLTDPRTKQVDGSDYVRLRQIPDGVAARFLSDFFLFANGDAHRAKRRLFARAFGYGPMRAARAGIRAIADDMVADLPRGETFDFVDRMADLGRPR